MNNLINNILFPKIIFFNKVIDADIDELKFYNKSLSSGKILADYNFNKTYLIEI